MKINGSAMSRVSLWMAVGVLALMAAGCGSAVSDPCTTQEDCGGQICLNERWTPGGYCSQPCTLGNADSCPGGTACVRDIISRDQAACLRTCVSATDCREGYRCDRANDSSSPVCIAGDGP